MSDLLPPGWVWGTIGDVAIVNPTTRKASIPDDLSVSFVPMAAVTEVSGRINLSEVRPARVLKPKGYRPFVDGDVLVAKITPSMENGKAAVARGLENSIGFGSTEFHVLRPLETMFAEYLFHYVVRESFRARAARAMTGTAGQLRVPPDFLRTAPIPIAPRVEQERIVAAIDEHFSRLDAAEATLRQALIRLDTLRSSVLTNAFCLNRELPSGWRVRTIGDVASVNPRVLKADIPDDLDVSFVPMAAVEEITGRIDLANSRPAIELKSKSYRGFIDGDVLVAKITPSMENGKAAIANGLHNSVGFGSTEFHVLRPKASILAEYLFYFIIRKRFRAEAARHMTGTAGQLRVPAEFLRTAPIPTAPIRDQREIAATIEEDLSRVASLEAAAGAIREKINSFRRSVLTAAFSGRLVPQDPADEPASMLLERIAAFRSAKPAHRRRTA